MPSGFLPPLPALVLVHDAWTETARTSAATCPDSSPDRGAARTEPWRTTNIIKNQQLQTSTASQTRIQPPVSAPGDRRGNAGSVSTGSTSPAADAEPASCPAVSVFIIITTVTGGRVYIELPTKCRDPGSGAGCPLLGAYLYSLRVSSYFPAVKHVQQYIHGPAAAERAAEGRMFMHRALEPAPGWSCRGRDARTMPGSWWHPRTHTGTG